jgi:hypothetical protein
MNPDEIRAFLLHGTRTGKLAVSMKSGDPHVKGRWITADGRVSLCVDEEVAPYAFVHLRGRASYSEELGEMLRWATLIGGRYMGEKRAGEYGRCNAVAGELLVRLTPERVIAKTGVAD